jgi:hypothetical protein
MPSADRRMREDQRAVVEALTAVRVCDPQALAAQDDAGARGALETFLTGIGEKLEVAADALDRDSFIHRLPQRTFGEQVAR